MTNLRADEWASLQDFAPDQAIREAVIQRLAEEPATRLFVRSLTVDVQGQRVKLGGYVRTQLEAEQAAAVARSVPGVLAVDRAIRTDEDLVRAQEFASAMKVSYPLMFDTGSGIGRDYLLEKMPMTILVDRAGVVRYSNVGFKRGDERAYLDHIRELLRE